MACPTDLPTNLATNTCYVIGPITQRSSARLRVWFKSAWKSPD